MSPVALQAALARANNHLAVCRPPRLLEAGRCFRCEDAGALIEGLARSQRERDLIRHQRMELFTAGLITDLEYADLAKDHGGGEPAGRL